MQTTTLKELAEEYIKSAGDVSCMIASCNEKLRCARQSGNRELEFRLHNDLLDLYTQRNYLQEIAVFLKNYYNKERIQ